ncbi:MAG: C40 family peptidase [Halochromatium sp.]|uniref:C40 family peptidase n=1 Tax=Halochromatium sp. TaxID=2049430 RepID=UPI0039780293
MSTIDRVCRARHPRRPRKWFISKPLRGLLLASLGCALGCALLGCTKTAPTRDVEVAGERFDLTGLEPKRADLVTAALAQIGTPYAYGGETPHRALDCSGLTLVAHQAVGMRIPRVSTQQQAAARPLQGPPQPGDLVFFRTAPSQYHVGLMVDRQRFVHASTSKRRVRLADLDNPYWRERFLGAGSYL